MTPPSPRRGEVWSVRFDPTIGSEYRKTRPAVVLSSNAFGRHNMRVVVPITGWDQQFHEFVWMVRLHPTARNGLTKESAADASQVKSVSVQRLEHRLDVLHPAQIQELSAKANRRCAESTQPANKKERPRPLKRKTQSVSGLAPPRPGTPFRRRALGPRLRCR